jgi:hypothetical protein
MLFLMKVGDGVEQLYFTTALITGSGRNIETGEKVGWTGTAFIYGVQTDKGQVNFLVSNKHVFNGEDGVEAHSLRVRLIAAGDQAGQPAFGEATSVKVQREKDDGVVGHPDEEVDVAVMPMGVIHKAMIDVGNDPFFRVVGGEVVISEAELLKQASALEDIVFVGYPSGIYDTANLTPVIRRGITATPLALDYQGKPAYLIDAAVFGGSSGSPVFLYGPASRREGALNTLGVGNRILFGGILASVHTHQELGAIVDLPTALATLSNPPLGLGIVYKPKTIDECIDQRLGSAGFKRVAGETSAEGSDSDTDSELPVEPSKDS